MNVCLCLVFVLILKWYAGLVVCGVVRSVWTATVRNFTFCGVNILRVRIKWVLLHVYFVEALFVVVESLESQLLSCNDCFCFRDLPGQKEKFPCLNYGHYKNRESRIWDFENGGMFLANPGNVLCARHPGTNYLNIWINSKIHINRAQIFDAYLKENLLHHD